jgi:hypothetical protein
MPRSTKFNRLVVAGIAAAAISPTAALASPAIDGGVPAPHTQDLRAPDQVAGGAPGTGVMQDLRAPDQVARPTIDRQTPVADGDGVDGGVLVAIGGGALLLVGGIGLASRKRLQLVRQRQPA